LLDGNSPLDRKREEERLNLIFAQIDDSFEGVRNNAATAIYEWMCRNRPVNPGIRLVIAGTSAERTLRTIKELERRNQNLQDEVRMLREHIGPSGLRKMERQQKLSAENHLADLIEAIKTHLYQGLINQLPRGVAKVIAGILNCSETTARSILRGGRPVTLEEVEKIRSATPLRPPPAPRKTRGRSGHRRPSKSKSQLSLDEINAGSFNHGSGY
jgi:hypothetical protein